MASKDVSLRKRQQIAKASRVMFLWVAGASVVIGASGVVIYVLASQLIFNEKVIAEKNTTVGTLDHNLSIVDKLNRNIRVKNTNELLMQLRSEPDTEPIQVIFDALPASANSAALGSSLQSDKLLGQEGIRIDSLSVSPVSGVEDDGEGDSGSEELAVDSEVPTIEFSFTVSAPAGDAVKLKELLQRLERSIRTMNIVSTRFENQSNTLSLTVTGVAYYQPAKSVSLKDKAVRP